MTQLLGLFGLLNAEEGRKHTAWANATSIPGSTDKIDCDGRIIRWSEYGQRTTYGWEIDHIRPTILGGGDGPYNLRARDWQGNRSAGGMLGSLLSGIGGDRS